MHTQPDRFRTVYSCLSAMLVLAVFSPLAVAQTNSIPTRVVQPIDSAQRTVLVGNTYYLARTRYDSGVAPAELPMQRMMLVLKRGPEQESALEQFLQDQQNSSSPNYHKWLTPQQFGAQYGPSPDDIQKVAAWLQSQGFAVNGVSNGATVIEFSGTAGQIQSSFHTTIHKYTVNGADHWANANDPSIPAALAPVVVGIETLHNFPRKAMNVISGVYTKGRSTGFVKQERVATPQLTFGCGTTSAGSPRTCFAIGPYDFGTIYNVLPLWNATPAIDGTGQTIAIVGESDVDMADIESFQSFFGLPTKDPIVVMDGPDPGIVPGDETESDIDLEWSGSVAKGATIKFVIAATTNTTLGVDLAAQHAVDQNIAPVISESYGICEAALGTTGNQFYNSLWQQAAAQGITVILSAGDNGSAGCDDHDAVPPSPAEFGLQVSGFASTPYNIAVGGTDFNDIAAPLTFWNSTSTQPTQESAKGYVPEVPWNDTCTNSALSFFGYTGTAVGNCNNPALLDSAVRTLGGSGGKSSCTSGSGQDITSCSGGYAKPSWQTGAGVPADGKRDVPDVSLFAATGYYSSSFYVVCAADRMEGLSCSSTPLAFLASGGTSVSAPAFSGIMAMVNQKTGSRQGNANYTLYGLATQSGASCPSAGSPPTSCVFYDVTTGTNAAPCDGTGATSVNCGTAGSEGLGVLTGYSAGVGYDLATGLGSMNVANLVMKWATFSNALKPSATTLALSPITNIVHGSSVNVTIGVSAVSPGTGTPSGTVALDAPASIDPGVTGFTLTAGAANTTTDVLPGGAYSVTAHYPGDNVFAASNSAPVSVTVTPEPSTVAISAITVTSNGFPQPFTSGPYGSFIVPRVDVAGNSGNGFPSGNVTIKDNNQAINGGLILSLDSQGNALPSSPIFNFPAGSHSLSASYAGDASFNSASSVAPATFTIQQDPVMLGLTEVPQIIQLGNAATISAAFSGSGCGNPPAGTMTFFDGAAQLGGPQTIQASVMQSTCTFGGAASINLSTFSQGLNSITVKYSGDNNYSGATSAASTLDAKAVTTSTLAASTSTIQQGQSVTLTATVASSVVGGPAATGNVTFVLPSQTVSLGASALSNGKAQITTTALPVGSTQIAATYVGDTNYSDSSAMIVEQVNPGPDFSVTFSPAAVIINTQGASATTMLTVTGTNGFNTPLSFAGVTCSGLPSEATCTINPTTVPVGGAATLTITTTAPSSGVPVTRPSGGIAALSGLSATALIIVALLLATQLRRRRMSWLVPAALFLMLIVTGACGGGGGGGGTTPPANPGTPLVQNKPITVNVTSGSITHAFTFTLTVN